MKNMYLQNLYLFSSFLPSKEDLELKIEKVTNEFFKETPKLPRKLKKKRRKELNSEYSFLKAMQNFNLTL